MGFKGSDFLNLVVKIDTVLEPVELISELHRIEEMTGRVTGTKAFNDRTLDIDVLLYDEVVNIDLNIPRDEILKYGFVAFLISISSIGERQLVGGFNIFTGLPLNILSP